MLPLDERIVSATKEISKICESHHLPYIGFKACCDLMQQYYENQPYMPSVDFTDVGIANFLKMAEEYNDDTLRIRFGEKGLTTEAIERYHHFGIFLDKLPDYANEYIASKCKDED